MTKMIKVRRKVNVSCSMIRKREAIDFDAANVGRRIFYSRYPFVSFLKWAYVQRRKQKSPSRQPAIIQSEKRKAQGSKSPFRLLFPALSSRRKLSPKQESAWSLATEKMAASKSLFPHFHLGGEIFLPSSILLLPLPSSDIHSYIKRSSRQSETIFI